MSIVTEEWRDIPGTDGQYRISNLGNAHSIDRLAYFKSGIAMKLKGKPLRVSHNHAGYPVVNILRKPCLVHRLVALAFIGTPTPERYEVNHKNGIKVDNRLENLEYCSAKENTRHAIDTGLSKVNGEDSHFATCKHADILRAYELVRDGLSVKQAAIITGISRWCVKHAIQGNSWGLSPLPAKKFRLKRKHERELMVAS